MAISKDELLPLLRDPEVAAAVHAFADTDVTLQAIHHTIGPGSAQVLQGNHKFGFDDFAQARDTPNAPTGISVISNNLLSPEGIIEVEAIITWTPVTGNTNGTSINADDLDAYLVSWRVATTGDWSPDFEVNPDSPVAYFFGLRPGQHIDVRVTARNLAQNVSAPGYAFDVVLSPDVTPPNQPSKPVVASLFGAIRVQWDGKDSVGAQMALDFDHIDVHVGSASSFVADDTNKIDSIPTLNGGSVVLSYTDYGTNHYVKFRAVDKTGNISTQSVASDPVAARQGVNADFQDVSATKITAGKLSVDVGLAGRILIGPLNADGTLVSPLGARMELRNDGIHIFNGSNVEVATMAIVSGVPQINISGPIVSGGTISGATIIGGVLETATSGKRVVVDGSINEIGFYDSSGVKTGYLGASISGASLWIGKSTSTDGSAGSAIGFDSSLITTYGTMLKRRTITLYDTSYIDFKSVNGNSYGSVGMSGNRLTQNVDGNSRVTLNHQLGNTPVTFGAIGADAAYDIRNWSKDASQIVFEIRGSSGGLMPSGTSVTIDWWAIG